MIVVQKASARPKRSKRAWPIQTVAIDIQSEIANHILKGLLEVRGRVPKGKLAAALVAAKEDEVIQIVDAAGMRATFSSLGPLLEKGAMAGSRTIKQQLVMDPTRPRLKRWLDEHVAQFVKETAGTSKDAIREIIRNGVLAGRHPMKMAKDIQNVIGLTGPQALAVSRRYDYLVQRGMTRAKADLAVEKYSEKLLKQRARVIAQTESTAAVNAGRRELWLQLQENGALDEGQLKKWDATFDGAVCPICAAMGKMEAIPIHAEWQLPRGGSVSSPPAHPGCRCHEVLL